MLSSIIKRNQSQKHSGIENGSNPQTDAASRSLEGHPQLLPLHGSSFRPSGMILFNYFMALVVVVFAPLVLVWYFTNMIGYTFIKPKEATVQLVSFSANNFNITDGVLEVTWEATMTVVNPNKKFMADFSEIESCIYYNELVHSLACELREPFTMDEKSNTMIIMKRSMSEKDHQPQRWVVDDMEKERNGGSVSLRLARDKGWCQHSRRGHYGCGIHTSELQTFLRGYQDGVRGWVHDRNPSNWRQA